MKVGCCVSMLSSPEDPLGVRYLPQLSDYGYDYVELPLARIMDLSDQDFDMLLGEVERIGVPCECCNDFFPAAIRLTGDDVSEAEVEEYLHRALARAARLGVRVVVFGSSKAKNVPEGFDKSRAFEQVVGMLRRAAVLCADYNITIAIEPLNRQESNLILNLSEGEALLKSVNSPQVQMLVDYYHFELEGDTCQKLEQLVKAGHIVHVHFAHPEGRVFPRQLTERESAFFKTLRDAGYAGRCSIEAYSTSPENDLLHGRELFC